MAARPGGPRQYGFPPQNFALAESRPDALTRRPGGMRPSPKRPPGTMPSSRFGIRGLQLTEEKRARRKWRSLPAPSTVETENPPLAPGTKPQRRPPNKRATSARPVGGRVRGRDRSRRRLGEAIRTTSAKNL